MANREYPGEMHKAGISSGSALFAEIKKIFENINAKVGNLIFPYIHMLGPFLLFYLGVGVGEKGLES